MKKTRTKHNPAFKAKVALAALRDQESVAEIARRYKVHANVVYKWKRQLLDNAAQSFETDHGDGGASEREDVLLKKIGELTVERDFLSNGLGRSMTQRRVLMAPNGTLDAAAIALLAVTRSSVYYEPVVPDAEELALMRRIDELHQHPFFGSRMITQTLKAEGPVINRKRVQRLMRLMGLESTAPQPTTSTPAPDHPVYPYLLRGLTIARPNQVWATDITYIPMARGFAYLVAIIDWYSRRVLAWRLSNTLDTGFCIEALRDALAHFGADHLQHRPGLAVHGGGRVLRDRGIKTAWTARAATSTTSSWSGSEV